MNKYIVKNCPALRGWVCNEQFIRQDKMVDCQDCTDCLIKQVIELCKDDMKPIREWREGDVVFVEYKKDVHLANDILQLFEIEECE